jgi:hypothetical protein
LVLNGCTLANNSASGGPGSNGPRGWDGNIISGFGGDGQPGGDGQGSALYNAGTASLINCTITGSTASGGNGGNGGNGGIAYNPTGKPSYGGGGGNGGRGGFSYGSIYTTNGVCLLTNCTIAANFSMTGSGGAPGLGGYGNQVGGVGGPGPPGNPGASGQYAGPALSSNSIGINTVLAFNFSRIPTTPSGGNPYVFSSNADPAMGDAGHNLSSDASVILTNTGSLYSTSPYLGALANNGGPTWTMALLPGSAGIDAADPAAAPPTDQRGIARPIGPAPDIGAFEYGLPAVLQMTGSRAAGLDLRVTAYPGLSCHLLTSCDLSNWTVTAITHISPDGSIHFRCDPTNACGYFRVVIP